MNTFEQAPSCVLGVLVSALLLACGNVVIVEGEDGDTGTVSTGTPFDPGTSSSSSSSGEVTSPPDPPPPSDDCTNVCAPGADADHCACKRYCSDPSFTKPNAKIACAPLAEGSDTIQCVCTYGEDFSGVCYEKTGNLCDFDLGCCAKYFYGK